MMSQEDKSFTLTLLKQLKSEFTELRTTANRLSAHLIHRATNAEAEGVKGIPPHLDNIIAFDGAGSRYDAPHMRAAAVEVPPDEATLDVNGTPVLTPDGRGLRIPMPQFRDVSFFGESSDHRQLTTIADRAGRLLRSLGDTECLNFASSWRFSSPRQLWWAFVFEVAWNGSHPLLEAQKRIWVTRDSQAAFFIPYEIQQVKSLIEMNFGPS